MRLLVLGSNGTYPTPGRPASGYLVEHAGFRLLLDLGPGVFPAVLGIGDLPDAIVISHRHPDHCLDALPLLNHLRFDRPQPIPLYAPEGVVEALALFIDAKADHPLYSMLPATEISPGDDVVIGPLTCSFGAAVHPVPAVVTRVEVGGHALTYSGDTGPGGDLVTLADGVDLLLCEATDQGVPTADRYPYHLTASEAGSVAAEAGVGTLVLTHVAPSLDPEVSVSEAAAVFPGPVHHATPGWETTL